MLLAFEGVPLNRQLIYFDGQHFSIFKHHEHSLDVHDTIL